jgi:hypothetical protein
MLRSSRCRKESGCLVERVIGLALREKRRKQDLSGLSRSPVACAHMAGPPHAQPAMPLGPSVDFSSIWVPVRVCVETRSIDPCGK